MTITITNQDAILRVILTILVVAVAGSFLINGVIPLIFSTINRRNRRGGSTEARVRPVQARDFYDVHRRIAVDHGLTVTRIDTGSQFRDSYTGVCACGDWKHESDITHGHITAAHELHLDRLTYELIENGAKA